jgi:hypothetical protein
MLPALLLIARRNALQVLAPVLVVIAPHLLWSIANDGLPYSFQAQRLGAGMNTPEFLLGQLAGGHAGVGVAGSARAETRNPR